MRECSWKELDGECALITPETDGVGEAGRESELSDGRRDTRASCLCISSLFESRRLLHTADAMSSSDVQADR